MATEKPSALAALKALSKKQAPAAPTALTTQITDPAIAGAQVKKGSSTVTLGFDPAIAASAEQCAGLKAALESAVAEFEVTQATMRDYGSGKRCIYNNTFKADITSVKVPYTVETPTGPETRHVMVVCANKYSVRKEIVLNNKDSLGDAYDKLFVEEKSKSLKPNAEELFRNLLTEIGLSAEEVSTSMDTLFEETVKVAATKDYEKEVQKLPDVLQTLLSQAVTRVQPGLKFE